MVTLLWKSRESNFRAQNRRHDFWLVLGLTKYCSSAGNHVSFSPLMKAAKEECVVVARDVIMTQLTLITHEKKNQLSVTVARSYSTIVRLRREKKMKDMNKL